MALKRFLCIFLMVSAGFAGCDFSGFLGRKSVITVGKTRMDPWEFKREIKRLASDLEIDSPGIKEVMDSLVEVIVERLLVQEFARENGMEVSVRDLEEAIDQIKKDHEGTDFEEVLVLGYIDFDEWKEGLRQQLLRQKVVEEISRGATSVTFEEIKNYYETHMNEFERPARIKFRQIVTKTHKEAQDLLARLKAGEDMVDLANQYSIVPYIGNEKQASWIAPGDLDEPLDKAVFSLAVGVLSPVIETSYGYHILEIIDKQSEGVVPLPDANNEIEAKLLLEKRQSFCLKWLEGLRDRYVVSINRELINHLEFE